MKLIEATCRCCTPAMALLPREDLGPGMAVCPRSGRSHVPQGQHYTLLAERTPQFAVRQEIAPVVQIDLSRDSYA